MEAIVTFISNTGTTSVNVMVRALYYLSPHRAEGKVEKIKFLPREQYVKLGKSEV